MQSIEVEAGSPKRGQVINYYDDDIAETASVMLDKTNATDEKGSNYAVGPDWTLCWISSRDTRAIRTLGAWVHRFEKGELAVA